MNRSPLAPKKTMLHGLVTRSDGRPSRSGLLAAPSPLVACAVAIELSGIAGHARTLNALSTTALSTRSRDVDVALEVDANAAATAFVQRHPIAQCLCCQQRAESHVHARYHRIVGILGGDLQDHARIGTALVELAGGMQKARTKADRRRDACARRESSNAARRADPGVRVSSDVCGDRGVVAGAQLCKEAG